MQDQKQFPMLFCGYILLDKSVSSLWTKGKWCLKVQVFRQNGSSHIIYGHVWRPVQTLYLQFHTDNILLKTEKVYYLFKPKLPSFIWSQNFYKWTQINWLPIDGKLITQRWYNMMFMSELLLTLPTLQVSTALHQGWHCDRDN